MWCQKLNHLLLLHFNILSRPQGSGLEIFVFIFTNPKQLFLGHPAVAFREKFIILEWRDMFAETIFITLAPLGRGLSRLGGQKPRSWIPVNTGFSTSFCVSPSGLSTMHQYSGICQNICTTLLNRCVPVSAFVSFIPNHIGLYCCLNEQIGWQWQDEISTIM